MMSRAEAARGSRPLAERSALVTGAASGIGRATAMALARAGAAVAVVDLDGEGGPAVAREIVGLGGRALFVAADLGQGENCRGAVARTVEGLGGLDILVNVAGIIRRASVLETSEEEWDRIMSVNVRAAFLLSKHAIPIMAAAGGGAIINVASGWGLVGGRRAAAYCASKGALVLLTKAMALDHGEVNVRVNCVCPGDTDTPALRGEADQLGQPAEDLLARSAAARPLGRLTTPDDIAGAVLYLASDAAAAVTGATLVVDSGGLAGTS